MQILFTLDGHTRNLFIYAEDGKVGDNNQTKTAQLQTGCNCKVIWFLRFNVITNPILVQLCLYFTTLYFKTTLDYKTS